MCEQYKSMQFKQVNVCGFGEGKVQINTKICFDKASGVHFKLKLLIQNRSFVCVFGSDEKRCLLAG